MGTENKPAKGPQPHEGEAKQMAGLDLESVIERARGRDAEALAEIYRRYSVLRLEAASSLPRRPHAERGKGAVGPKFLLR